MKMNFQDKVPKNYKPKKKKLDSRNTIGFRGVRKNKNRYRAAIYADGTQYHLGYFGTPREAAIAFDVAAIQAGRPTSYLNFPDMIHVLPVKKKILKRKKKKIN